MSDLATGSLSVDFAALLAKRTAEAPKVIIVERPGATVEKIVEKTIIKEVGRATRESWLATFVDKARFHFANRGVHLPNGIKVSCGFPALRRIGNTKVLGESYSYTDSANGSRETFISPTVSDTAVLGIALLHELCHHAAGHQYGHRGPFSSAAQRIGLVRPLRVPTAGPMATAIVALILQELGPYPHAELNLQDIKRQGTRMLKVQCPGCGCTIRMTRHWLDKTGAPFCACLSELHVGGNRMAEV